jgi:hypothetical protein
MLSTYTAPSQIKSPCCDVSHILLATWTSFSIHCIIDFNYFLYNISNFIQEIVFLAKYAIHFFSGYQASDPPTGGQVRKTFFQGKRLIKSFKKFENFSCFVPIRAWCSSHNEIFFRKPIRFFLGLKLQFYRYKVLLSVISLLPARI